MTSILTIFGIISCILAVAGCIQLAFGTWFVTHFPHKEKTLPAVSSLPPVTILKPLCGIEPFLEEALDSFCTQDYPDFQILFGIHDTNDPALAIVQRLCDRYPHRHLQIIIDPTIHGLNRKVSNIINLLPYIQHDFLVISDSDIHVKPDYLRHVVTALHQPNTGLVTTPYAGLPTNNSIIQALATCQLNHSFLPGVLLSRRLGRQDCFGATMALQRHTLNAIGGFDALLHHVADDAILGKLVRRQQLDITIAPCLTWTTITESHFQELLQHELRWGRTIYSISPLGYIASSLQFPLFWATLTMLFFYHTILMGMIFFCLVWGICAWLISKIDCSIGLYKPWTLFLLPLRDWLSAIVMVGSISGTKVSWRGHILHINKQTSSPGHFSSNR